MNPISGQESPKANESGGNDLVRRYAFLLNLYSEMELVSKALITVIEQGSHSWTINEKLSEKMQLADRIVQESQAIASLKKNLADRDGLSEDDRIQVRTSEQNLSEAMSRIIAQENWSRDLVARQGIKVSRR
jgi:hypothetical protein